MNADPIMQYGIERFCQKCQSIGIDGLIIPDLPIDIYPEYYKEVFDKFNLYSMFLITPQTPDARIHFIDSISNGFIYMVSSASVTGAQNTFGKIHEDYFKRIANMKLSTPQIVGFGIRNASTYQMATKYSRGGIIGAAFIKFLEKNGVAAIPEFIKSIR